MGASRGFSSPFRCVAVAALMSGIWTVGKLGAQQPPSPHAAHLQEMADHLDTNMQALAAAEGQISRDTFDVQPVVKAVGADPVKGFEWVRDHTSWAPYTGILRGPAGVLMDRMGNSLDRSLLLAELLRRTGATVRLAHGTLDDKHAAELLERLLALDAQATPQRAAPPQADAKFAQMQKQIVDLAAAQVSAVGTAIGPGAAPDISAAKSRALKALADHWWVQVQQNGQWIDYDVLLPDAKPGLALTAAAETLEINEQGAPKLAADESMWHRVVVRVIAEQWKAGHLTEGKVLEKSLHASQVLGKRIALSNIPLDWPTDAGRMDSPQGIEKVKAAILAQHEWAPELEVGDEVTIQSSVTSHGQINPKPLMDPMARTGGGAANAASKALDAFGDTPAAPKEEGQFTAEWIEYTLCCPGQPDRAFRREIFDLIGPAARAKGVLQEPAFADPVKIDAGLLMLGEVDILPLPCQLSTEFAGHVVLADIVANRSAFSNLLRRMAAQPGAKSEPYHPQPAQLYAMAAMRCQWNAHRQELFLDSPNVLTYHFGFKLTAANETHVWQAFDIVANQLAVRPRSWAQAYGLRMEQGILDTNLETLFVAAAGRRDNAAEAMAQSPADQWVTVHSADDPQWNQVQISPDARARVCQDLAEGRIALVPFKPLATGAGDSIAWWVVDPATGGAIGKGPNGFGGAMGEYSAMLQRITVFVEENKTWICMGKITYEAASYVAIMLGMPGVGTIASDISNVLTAVCGEP
jgi:hypothetical protein